MFAQPGAQFGEMYLGHLPNLMCHVCMYFEELVTYQEVTKQLVTFQMLKRNQTVNLKKNSVTFEVLYCLASAITEAPRCT